MYFSVKGIDFVSTIILLYFGTVKITVLCMMVFFIYISMILSTYGDSIYYYFSNIPLYTDD